MPKVTLEYKRKAKRNIIDAAIKLFAKYGYEKTTTDDLADSARISVGTLYLYFPSKEELFKTICTELDKKMIQDNKTVFSNDKELESELDQFYDNITKSSRFFDSILIDAVNESKNNVKLRRILLEIRNNAVRILEETMRDTKNAGVFLQNCKDLKSICSGILAMYDGLSMARQVKEDYELQKNAFVKTMAVILRSY